MKTLLGSVDCRKIVVLGNPNVGKTSIIQRYVHNQFKTKYYATLGFNIYTRYIDILEKRVGLSVWDIGGQEAFKQFAFRYLIETDAAIFVADVSRPETIESLSTWNEKLSQAINRKIPKIILFNKIDLNYDMNVIADEVINSEVRKEVNGIVFASAKTGQNVVDIFSMIAKMLTTWDEEFGVPRKRKVLFNNAFEEKSLPVMFFSGPNCDFCNPVYDRLTNISSEYPMTIKVIDVEADKNTASEHGILSIPTIIIGTKTIVGESNEQILRTIVSDEYTQLFGI